MKGFAENKNSEDRIGKEFVFNKLGKSLIAEKTIKKNEIFSINNLSGKIFVENGCDINYAGVIRYDGGSSAVVKGTKLKKNTSL